MSAIVALRTLTRTAQVSVRPPIRLVGWGCTRVNINNDVLWALEVCVRVGSVFEHVALDLPVLRKGTRQWVRAG